MSDLCEILTDTVSVTKIATTLTSTITDNKNLSNTGASNNFQNFNVDSLKPSVVIHQKQSNPIIESPLNSPLYPSNLELSNSVTVSLSLKFSNKLWSAWLMIKWYLRVLLNVLFNFHSENSNKNTVFHESIEHNLLNESQSVCLNLDFKLFNNNFTNYDKLNKDVLFNSILIHLPSIEEIEINYHTSYQFEIQTFYHLPICNLVTTNLISKVSIHKYEILKLDYQTYFTQIDHYKADLLNGNLNIDQHNDYVQHLLNLVLPRNLSNIDILNNNNFINTFNLNLSKYFSNLDLSMDNNLSSSNCFEMSEKINNDFIPEFYLDDNQACFTSKNFDQIVLNNDLNCDLNKTIPDSSNELINVENEQLIGSHQSRSNNTNKNLKDLQTFLPFEGTQLLNLENETVETPKPKRSSSLKSTRTPPDTPVHKVVRFADVLGLDLTSVRQVFDFESPPKIPASAIVDLKIETDDSIAKIGAKHFRMCFSQPCASSGFIRRVLLNNVSLEESLIQAQQNILTGFIRIKSLGFEKHVFVRITYNNWVTFFDHKAAYVQNSYDGVTDRFSFSIILPDTMRPDDKVFFAICYKTPNGEQFWDNNQGHNYIVICYAKATDLAGDGSWLHYL